MFFKELLIWLILGFVQICVLVWFIQLVAKTIHKQ
jgi:hypothetical protein